MKLLKKLKTIPTLLVLFIVLNFLNILDSQRAKPKQSVFLVTTSKGTCSAFVISNTQAITAGHCVDGYTMEQIEMGKRSVKANIQRLNLERMLMQFVCNQSIDCLNDINESFDHLVSEQLRTLEMINRTKPEVLSLSNFRIEVDATAYRQRLNEQDGDYAVLVGDFRGFRKVKMSTIVNIGERTTSIGYVSGRQIITSNVITGKMINFIKTDGHLIRGMSGGGLFNSKGEVVGINSMYDSDNSYYTHTGLIDLTEF